MTSQIGSELLEKVGETSNNIQSALGGVSDELPLKSLENLASEKVLEEISQPKLDAIGTLLDIFGSTEAFLVGAV